MPSCWCCAKRWRCCGGKPEAEAGLGGRDGVRRPGAAAPGTAANGPAGDAGHAVALAPAAGPLAVDLSPPGTTPAGRCPGRGADQADGAGEPGLCGAGDYVNECDGPS